MGILKQHAGGKFLASSDLDGDGKPAGAVYTISDITEADVSRQDDDKSEIRPILEFKEAKGLVLNKTNLNFILAAWGDDESKIVGKKIGVFVDPTVQFAGKTVKGLRLCDHKEIIAADKMDDDIPFGN